MQVSPSLAQAVRAEQAQVDEACEREQRLVRRDVRCRLLSADVLLARLQRQHEAALACGVDRLADDAAGQAADVVGTRGQEAVVRAAVAHRVTGRLALADRHRTAVVARRLEHTEADVRSTCAIGSAPASFAAAARSGAGSRQPKKFGCLEDRRPPRRARPRARARGRSTPPSCGTSTTSSPKPGAYVLTTWRTCGLVASVITIFERPVACFATKHASAATVDPS